MTPRVHLVLVHGLFYGRASMSVLAGRLSKPGFEVARFPYQPTRAGLGGAAAALARYVRERDAPGVHLVGHSFGGLAILRAWADDGALPPGRAVLLGSPLQGSRVARRLMRRAPGRALLGAAGPPLVHGYPGLPKGREIGMIAGNAGLGLGRLTGERLGASDGTVALDEADAAGLTARIVLGVSHTGLLFSGAVAHQVAHFLQHGSFEVAGGIRA